MALICSVENCEVGARSGGLCSTHALWKKAGKDLNDPVRRQRRKHSGKCSYPGCDRPYYGSGYCAGHYQRSKNGRDMDAPFRVSYKDRKCTHPGCDRPYLASGYCSLHYDRSRRYSTLDMDAPAKKMHIGLKYCTVEGCDSLHQSSGFCRRHAHLYQTHSMTAEQMAFYGSQPCQICGSFEKPSIDHDHNCCPGNKSCGKCIRGVLCRGCNSGLGMFGDDPEKLEAAAGYLRRVG